MNTEKMKGRQEGKKSSFTECFRFRTRDFDKVFSALRSAGERVVAVGKLSLYRMRKEAVGDIGNGSFMIAISRKLKGTVNKNRAKRRLKHAAYEAGVCSGNSRYLILAVVRGDVEKISFEVLVNSIKSALN